MSIKIDKLIRSRRKTVGLEVTPEALLIVRAPRNLSRREISEIIDKERPWILKKQKFFRENHSKIREKDFIEGEEFLYLGRSYLLRIASKTGRALSVDDNFIYLSDDSIGDAREIIENWYKERAYDVVSQRAVYYSDLSGIKFNRINITSARKRWGSCSPNGNLNIAWRLVMAPPMVIDYVIVHELSHVEIRNHSKKFWSRVRAIIPDYKADEKWLRDNGHFLVV
ncbi:MAG: SprT family zinc-dependent metalloprotease [Thermodesulfobacteriota bacterium]